MNRVLIVDDDNTMRQNLSEALLDEGFLVDTVTNGEEAIQQVKAKEYDLTLLDLVMPGLSGMETLSAIHRENPKIRIIMMTAF